MKKPKTTGLFAAARAMPSGVLVSPTPLQSSELQQRHEAIALVLSTEPVATVRLPLRLESVANGSQGTTKGARFAAAAKTKMKREAGYLAGRQLRHKHVVDFVALELGAFLAVRITRVAPRSLDSHDNLGRASKALVDGLADAFLVNDRDPRVRYVCDQRKGKPKEYAVEVALYVKRETS